MKSSIQQGLMVLVFLGAPAVVFCQTPIYPRQDIAAQRIELATRELQRMKDLVEIGVEARIRLEQAEQDLTDAQDGAILERTLYTELADLDDQLEEDMVAAAQRRLDREKERIEQPKKLIASGLAPLSDLTSFEEELSSRQRDLDWAQSRARFRTEAAAWAKLTASISDAMETTPLEDQDFFTKGMEHYEGVGAFDEARDLRPLSVAFETEFDRPLPISADGETELHRTLGFDGSVATSAGAGW